MDTNLAFVSTEDLLDELVRRSTAMVFAGMMSIHDPDDAIYLAHGVRIAQRGLVAELHDAVIDDTLTEYEVESDCDDEEWDD